MAFTVRDHFSMIFVQYMTSGPIVAGSAGKKDNAVEDYRKLIGATNPAEAAEGTIRKKYATSIEANAVHGSDSDGERSKLSPSSSSSPHLRFTSLVVF